MISNRHADQKEIEKLAKGFSSIWGCDFLPGKQQTLSDWPYKIFTEIHHHCGKGKNVEKNSD